jgi:hypothetical protein
MKKVEKAFLQNAVVDFPQLRKVAMQKHVNDDYKKTVSAGRLTIEINNQDERKQRALGTGVSADHGPGSLESFDH